MAGIIHTATTVQIKEKRAILSSVFTTRLWPLKPGSPTNIN